MDGEATLPIKTAKHIRPFQQHTTTRSPHIVAELPPMSRPTKSRL